MGYSLDPLSDDCYEGTSVLVNKFDIRDGKQLDILEQGITSALIAKAFIEIPFESVDFEFYKNLHKYVFDDVYEWAGSIRQVDMSKKGTSFCDCDKIQEHGDRIFALLIDNNYLANFSGEHFIEEFTTLYCSLNYLHPFREGNGRIQRLFLSMMLKSIGKVIDFTKVDKDVFMVATIKSATGDTFLLKDIFREIIN